MNLLRNIRVYCLIAGLTIMVFAGCSKDDEPQQLNTIADMINEDPNLSMFKAAIAKTKLEAFTEGPGPFTVFVPDNNAFKAAGINTEADLALVDSNILVLQLTYHILSTPRSTFEIPTGPNAPIATQLGVNLFASKNKSGTFLNGTKIVNADIQCANGVVHLVDRVLVPPSNTISTYLLTPGYRLLALAMGKANILSTLSPATTAPVTLFAPTNAAFIAAGLDSATIANTSAATLTNILRYHLVAGRLYSSDMKADSLKSVYGPNTYISLAPAPTIRGLKNGGPSSMPLLDVNASNGVIHRIDSVLRY